MRIEPQPAPYAPDPKIAMLAAWLADPVAPADFPLALIRFRNRRWDAAVGLDKLDDAAWRAHFARFAPMDGNLPQPLALRYHGHQFRVYNPQIGDGRGFLFAQLRDGAGRLLDLGTKGSGQTPYSRFGDGRLTLKGAVREILATEMLEALGVNTSKTFSVIETGEALERNDEPSPTRSAVMVRLSHGHIRIGSFQRLYALDEHDHLADLVDYCLATYPGTMPPDDAPGRTEPAVILLHQVVERLADLAAAYMVAGFVHGVLNTDNMNITGESFDYGPWRWLPEWDRFFTAAYFDHEGLYAFGRQPEAISWNCQQLAQALTPLAEPAKLVAALERFGELYRQALARRFVWRLGLVPRGFAQDMALVEAGNTLMKETNLAPDAFYFNHFGGRGANGAFGDAIKGYETRQCEHPYWSSDGPETMLIQEVEDIWAAIDQHDDWSLLATKIAAVRGMGQALGKPPDLP